MGPQVFAGHNFLVFVVQPQIRRLFVVLMGSVRLMQKQHEAFVVLLQ